MTPTVHEVSFRGEIMHGAAPLQGRVLALVAADLAADAEPRLAGEATEFVPIDRRPDRLLVDELAAAVREGRFETIAAVGAGCLLDAAKLVTREVDGDVRLVLVPCGPEPYRAVSRFAVVDDGDERPTAVEARFGAATVMLVPDLLSVLPAEIVAVFALDTAVHAIESLLSTRTHPYARMLAASALRVVASEDAADAESRARIVLAGFAAVEAFSTTRLGLAHALASPLGTRARITHDTINGVLGEALVAFWGDEIRGFEDVARAMGVEPSLDAVCGALASLRSRAGLPASLAALDIEWEIVSDVLAHAAQSSGISVLPREVSESDIESFAGSAWSGGNPKEMEHAQPA